ncbi:MAG: YeeE/YedE family protein [Planctomycetaceae bacterium]|nr:YeeE/YedE family protein [Planctomycetaceae bacterium]
MDETTDRNGWNPYLAGALVGVLAIGSAWATTRWMGKTHFLGASTTFVRAAGYVERLAAPEHVAQTAYFQKTEPKLDWQFMLVIGIFIGSLAGSLTDRSFKIESVPPIWRQRFGGSVIKRAAGAVIGGIVAMIGARLADGCPSGHGLSGGMQLSLSGLAAIILFFGMGILTAHFIYRERRAS